MERVKDKNVVLLELGVGFNTPTIIRFPFEQMTYQNPNWNLIRFNKDDCRPLFNIQNRIITVRDDITKSFYQILNEKESNK